MNIYYHSGSRIYIKTVLRDGFADKRIKQLDRCGVYVADSPGEPDPDYPDDQLLEITLLPHIIVSS